MSDNQIYFLIPAFKTNINFVLNGFVSSDEVSELKKNSGIMWGIEARLLIPAKVDTFY